VSIHFHDWKITVLGENRFRFCQQCSAIQTQALFPSGVRWAPASVDLLQRVTGGECAV
jgi:hypothetical protein